MDAGEMGEVLRVLKDERGRERQAEGNRAHRRAEVAQKPKPFSGREFLASSNASSRTQSPIGSETEDDSHVNGTSDKTTASLTHAKQHRDRLLNYQSQNARRTRIHDEAADYDVPSSGTNMWATPAERAMQLKRQQKALREVEWSAKPEWEKRKVVASIDVVGGKVVRRMVARERPGEDGGGQDDGHVEGGEEEVGVGEEVDGDGRKNGSGNGGGGAFSRNPLLGALIRPVARSNTDKDEERNKSKDVADSDADTNEDPNTESRSSKRSIWRRVQDDRDDNEDIILDGGAYGGRVEGRVLGGEERAVGATGG